MPAYTMRAKAGGPWLTILELFHRVRSSQEFRTLERARCSDSREKHRAPVVARAPVRFGAPLLESGFVPPRTTGDVCLSRTKRRPKGIAHRGDDRCNEERTKHHSLTTSRK